ncbi:hypothetical protein AUP42_06180 [Thalassospira lucentensis]|uniref:NACHT domain-containing protein n=1 Tax=Thalassospira lucentensis TaxID=168935 RepID=A0A154L0X4_9PROT|nr:hypothetical protein [Thalassospira lucentensis]KZB61544.1 hypothetical protein AUP42_06180 [Thalassospira lucentensis]
MGYVVAVGLACLFGVLFFILLITIIRMKLKQRASKARFALAVLSSILACLALGISAAGMSLGSIVAHAITQYFGIADVADIGSRLGQLGIFGMTALAITAIWRFGREAVTSWEAPPRMSEFELSKHFDQNSLLLLAYQQFKLMIERKEDAFTSEEALTWEQRSPELPKPVPNHVLLRDLFCSQLKEATIPDNGWRDRYKLWVGEVYQALSTETEPLVLLIFDEEPSQEQLEQRVTELYDTLQAGANWNIFGVYNAGQSDVTRRRKIDVKSFSIELISSRELILGGLDLHNYAREIVRQFEGTKVGGLDVTVANSFVPLDVYSDENRDVVVKLDDLLKEWVQEDSKRHLSITGEYGQGKSTAMLKYCYEWANKFIRTGDVGEKIPLLIELRSKSPSDADPIALLSVWGGRYGLLGDRVYNLIKSGGAIVIFEGFDELKNSGRAYDRHEHFNALWKFAFPQTKIIFTGRPNFFLNQKEVNRTLRRNVARAAAGAAFSEVWCLKKMTQSQVAEACRNFPDDIKQGILKASQENPDFLEIVSRPSMLPVVATIWKEIVKLTSEGEPLTGAILVEKYLEAIFTRKEAELERDVVEFDAPEGARYLVLHKSVRELLTSCVAMRMAALGGKNTISRVQVTDLVKDTYGNLRELCLAKGGVEEVLNSFMKFEEQYKNETLSDKVQIIVSDVCSAGILIPDPVGGEDNLRFPHKQFFEYLVCKGALMQLMFRENPLTYLLIEAVRKENLYQVLWNEPNSIKYMAECVGSSVSGEFFSRYTIGNRLSIIIWGFHLSLKEKIRDLFNRRKEYSIEEIKSVLVHYPSMIFIDRKMFFMRTAALVSSAAFALYFGFKAFRWFDEVNDEDMLVFNVFSFSEIILKNFLQVTAVFILAISFVITTMGSSIRNDLYFIVGSPKMRFLFVFLMLKWNKDENELLTLSRLCSHVNSALINRTLNPLRSQSGEADSRNPHTALAEDFIDIDRTSSKS